MNSSTVTERQDRLPAVDPAQGVNRLPIIAIATNSNRRAADERQLPSDDAAR